MTPAPSATAVGMTPHRRAGGRTGAALIVVMWTLLLLGMLVSQFVFEMQIEANITSYYRKRTKADALAKAGVEWAMLVLQTTRTVEAQTQEADPEDEDPVYLAARLVVRGAGVGGQRVELGEGHFTVDIRPEEGRRNVNRLTNEEWEYVLEQARVPVEIWDELIDCFRDWIDEDREHLLNGAEDDDPYYRERGYEPKNAPIDTLDELLLIKGFDERIVYGGPADDPEDEPILGIGPLLTTWGDGRINLNAASREVLLSVPGMTEVSADSIIEGRVGEDGLAGTADDGYQSVSEALAVAGMPDASRRQFTVRDLRYLRLVSVGEVQRIRSGIWCVLQIEDTGTVRPVFWREEPLP